MWHSIPPMPQSLRNPLQHAGFYWKEVKVKDMPKGFLNLKGQSFDQLDPETVLTTLCHHNKKW